MENRKNIIAYTDGACKGNPGNGGYGSIIIYQAYDENENYDEDNIVKKISGNSLNTTNNIMEITAVLETLKYVLEIIEKEENKDKITDLQVYIYSDSSYVVNGINNWLPNWVEKDFKDVKNVEYWKKMIVYILKLRSNNVHINLLKVLGHSGNKFNEMVDKLASNEANNIK